MWDEATAQAVFDDEADLWGFVPGDRHLVCSPMYHTVSIRFAAGTLLRGGSLVILGRYDAATALDVLRDLRPTTAFLVPTHLQRLLAPPTLGADERFGSLRLLAHAGEACPRPSSGRRWAASARGAVGVLRVDRRTVHGVCSRRVARAPRHGRSGPPGRRSRSPRRAVRRRDRPGGGDGPVGTIWCAVPPFARFSYWRDEAATAAAWRGDAFTVGDLGHLDDGRLPVPVGSPPRSDHLGGRQRLPGRGGGGPAGGGRRTRGGRLRDARRPVGRSGSAPRWSAATTPTWTPLRAAAADRLAPYKRPKQYLRTADLPHTATGKLLRRAVPEHLGLSGGRAWPPTGKNPPMAIQHRQPGDRRVEQTFEDHTPEEVEAKLARAAATFAAYRRTTFAERARWLTTAAELLEGELPDIARIAHHRDGQDLRRGQGRGGQVRPRDALVRRARRAAPGRRARSRRRRASSLVRYQPAGPGARRDAVELPAVAGGALRRARSDGRQRRPAEARLERPPDAPCCSRTCSAAPASPRAPSRRCCRVGATSPRSSPTTGSWRSP